MRIVIIVLAVVLLLLQVELWRQVGQIGELRRQVDAQLEQNASLQERNDALAAEVADLKSGLDAVEERARAELGLVRDGERFYLVVDPDDLPEGQSEAVRLLEALPEEPPPADAIDAEPDVTGPALDGNG
jgi:cell division protein FtsB